jgi:hypothetical protein
MRPLTIFYAAKLSARVFFTHPAPEFVSPPSCSKADNRTTGNGRTPRVHKVALPTQDQQER